LYHKKLPRITYCTLGVTYVSEKMQAKIGLKIQPVASGYNQEAANINLLDRWIDVNETHLVAAVLKEQTVDGEESSLVYYYRTCAIYIIV